MFFFRVLAHAFINIERRSSASSLDFHFYILLRSRFRSLSPSLSSCPPRFAQPAGPNTSLILLIHIHIHWRCGRHKHCYVQARDGPRNGDAMPDQQLVGRDRPRAGRVYGRRTVRKTLRSLPWRRRVVKVNCVSGPENARIHMGGRFPSTSYQPPNSKRLVSTDRFP